MGLEKDINQTKFRNSYQKAGINFIYTCNWINEKMKLFFDNHDITQQQFNILRILRGADKPLSTLQIRHRMLDKMSDTSRIVDRLVIKGLTKKAICKEDKRMVDVFITEKGKKLLAKIDAQQDELDGVLNNLSEADINTLNKLLDKIREAG
ncbi:MAG: MarR family transcriptional regulator [Ferruginibacter sp.]|nr:MarR family transcriptional regulator [Ferruginibacter sp.]